MVTTIVLLMIPSWLCVLKYANKKFFPPGINGTSGYTGNVHPQAGLTAEINKGWGPVFSYQNLLIIQVEKITNNRSKTYFKNLLNSMDILLVFASF